MIRKKVFHRWINLINGTMVVLGVAIIILLIPVFKTFPYRDIYLFMLSFISLSLLGLHIIMAGASGVLYKDIADYHGLFHTRHSRPVRGRRAVKTGWIYVIAGCFFIASLLYALYSASYARERIEIENKAARELFLQQYTNTQKQDSPEQPPHFMPR